MVLLYTWRQTTYFLDLSEFASPGGAAEGKPLFHRIPADWSPSPQALHRLQDVFPGDGRVYALTLHACADAHAISFWSAAAPTELFEPLHKPVRRKSTDAGKAGADDEDEDEDTDDEWEQVNGFQEDSDVDSHVSADSMVEPSASSSTTSSSSSSSSSSRRGTGSESSEPGLPRKVAAKAGLKRERRRGRWEATYYFIEDNRHTANKDCKMILRGVCCKPAALGTADMSKTRTPRHFGEMHEDPVRTFLILRAWAWQRCASRPFISGTEFRARDLAAEYSRLEREVRALRADDRLLGHAAASKEFRKWAPELADRLRSTP